eukprot:g19443.t1
MKGEVGVVDVVCCGRPAGGSPENLVIQPVAGAATPPGEAKESCTAGNVEPPTSPTMTNSDILRLLAEYIPDNQFLFFAPVSRPFREAWASRPTTTSWITADSSASQLRWSFECGLPRDTDHLCSAIARLGGSVDLLEFAREAGCPWVPEDVCSLAAKGGHLELLSWLHQNSCPWDEFTCSSASAGGHLEVLMWARERGCPWDTQTCSAAAGQGELDILRWARQTGCPWDEATPTSAAWGGHVHVLQYARENDCPFDEARVFEAARMKRHLVRLLEVGLIIDVERFPAFRTAFDPAAIDWDVDPALFQITEEKSKQGLHELRFVSGTLLLSDVQIELFTQKMDVDLPTHAVAKLDLFLDRRGNWSSFFKTPGLQRAPMCAWNMVLRRSPTIMSIMQPHGPWRSNLDSSTKAGSSRYIAWHIRTSDGDTARSFKVAKHRYIFHNQPSAKVCPLYISTLDSSRDMLPTLFAENGDVVPIYVSSNSKSMARNCSEAAEGEDHHVSAGLVDMGVADSDSHTAFSKNPESVINAFVDLLYLMDASVIVCTSSSFAGAVTAIKGYVGKRLEVEETVLASRHLYVFAPANDRQDVSLTQP